MDAATTGQPPGSPVAADGGPVLARMVLGLRLRRHRGEIPLPRAARAIGVPRADLAALEAGHVAVDLKRVIDLCELYGVADHAERAMLLGLAREANVPGWWGRYGDAVPAQCERLLGLEQTARVIRSFETRFVNPLLQIPGYTRGHIPLSGEDPPADVVERRLELLAHRQRVLYRDDPPHVWVVAAEESLRRPVGGRATMFRQLEHLADLCDHPRVTLQVVPSGGGGHRAGGDAFTLLALPGPGQRVSGELPDVVFLERSGAVRYLEDPAGVEYHRHMLNLLATCDAAPPRDTQGILREIGRTL